MKKICCCFFLVISAFLLGKENIPQQEEKTSTQYYAVGELGVAWQFPSDHLPVGGTVGEIHFVMWNILDSDALHHIERNSQGLRDSYIMTANVPVKKDDPLTVRESTILQDVMQMIKHPTHPRSLIALEEVSLLVSDRLMGMLPDNMLMLPQTGDDLIYGNLFIFDTNLFDLVDMKAEHYGIPMHIHLYIMTLSLCEKKTGLTYRFVQSHVPGGPVNSPPARAKFAEELIQNFDPNTITVVMGDMNRSSDYFLKNFEEAAAKQGLEKQPFENMPIPYPTHINTHMEASWIDNLFIANPFSEIESRVAKDASELFDELKPTLDLLEAKREESAVAHAR